MEEAQELRIGALKSTSDEFLIFGNEAVENSVTKPKVITQIIIKNSYETALMEKIWISFLSFHLFVVPAFLSLLLGNVPVLGGTGYDDEYEIAKQHLMVGLMGAAVVIGLPFHLLALADLEDAINEVTGGSNYSNSSSQTNGDSAAEPQDETDVIVLSESD
ncbi:uncharacterized protein LOC118183336 [Stegodyphus dumicola]|uniref:uncharacterized protein LOC118183336 n=1 Tax=Stegodyphus dumicola TaxID=202533 RepID=UPI0015AA461C|nr:uncharacterized protein LOC118183336 [Stegodyphus dumicola]